MKRVTATLVLAAIMTFVSTSRAQTPISSEQRVTITLPPALDARDPSLRKAILASGGAVAANGDFEIREKEYSRDELEIFAHPKEQYLIPGTSVGAYQIGQSSTGEAATVLQALIPFIAHWQQILNRVSQRSGHVELCMENQVMPGTCEASMEQEPALAAPLLIVNRTVVAQYVAAFVQKEDFGIIPVKVQPGQDLILLPPGKSVSLSLPDEISRYFFPVLLIADTKPFPIDAIVHPGIRSAGCVARLKADCVPKVSLVPAATRWTGTRTFIFAGDEPEPAMGGGEAAARGDSDWTVELYDTTPYTSAEIAADSALPPDKTKHLAKRTPEERAHACGGTIIARDIVITAAHCVAKGLFEYPNMKRVFTGRRIRLGSLRLGKGGETRAIVGMVVHSGYDASRNGSPNDIALLLIKRDETGVHLQPRSLKLGTQPIKPKSDLVGLGWGFTEVVAPNANIMSSGSTAQRNPSLLQQASLAPLSFEECRKRLKNRVKPTMVCLVTPKSVLARGGEPTFSCRGDSGGPLVRNYGMGTEELVGLTSWSLGCGYKDIPSVYTDVTQFARWIEAARALLKPGVAIKVTEPARAPRAARRQ